MKRRYSNCAECLPSPEYEHEIQLPKKIKPQLSRHEFLTTIDDALLHFVKPDGSKELKKLELITGEKLVVVFFGLRNNYMDPLPSSYDRLKSVFKTEVLGLSANMGQHGFNFPIANTTSDIVKKFNLLDPNGGGVYPRDAILIFDSYGVKRIELPVLMMGQYALDRPIVDILIDYLEGLDSS